MNQIQADTGVYLVTAPVLEGYEIVEYYGLVYGNAVVGANFVKDFFAGITDTLGGRSSGYEKATRKSMEGALTAMANSAAKLGANAVVAVDIKTGCVGKSLMTASCAGTAVIVRPRERS